MNRRDQLIEDLRQGSVNPHSTARAIQTMYNQRDEESLRRVRSTYIDTLLEGRFRNPISAARVVDENLYIAARLADIVKKCGYDGSGQLMGAANITSVNVGPVAQFYKETTGYQPPKRKSFF